MQLQMLSALLSFSAPATVQRWDIFTIDLKGPHDDGTAAPFEIDLTAKFTHDSSEPITVSGFFDGDDVYKLRFSPPKEGKWSYSVSSSNALLDGQSGTVVATPPQPGDHGPVESRGFGLVHADGTPHFSVGTTSYQWASQPLARQAQTLETLRKGYFNKMRMTVFPKWYVYNHANPVEVGTAYEIRPGSPAANASAWGCVGSNCPPLAGSFDLRRFNVSYWRNYERLLREMRSAGVVADIILFHPYDNGHWGFDCMGGVDKETYDTGHDKFYLRYLVSRLASFSNVWWSMANEWNFCECKSRGTSHDHLQSPSPVWDELFETLYAADPYRRQASIHNGALVYNHSRPWISHVSIQGLEEQTPELRARYGKPVIWDEVRYEGALPCCSWGSLSGEEEADRFWWGASLGVFVGHSETVLRADVKSDDDQPLWWAKGGELIGRSPERIRWLRTVWAAVMAREGGFGALRPTEETFGSSGGNVSHMLSAAGGTFHFIHPERPGRWSVPLNTSAAGSDGWLVAQLDYWGMGWRNSTLPPGAKTATIECSALPCNVMIFSA